MTATTQPGRQQIERATQIFGRDNSLVWDRALALAEEELATEAEQQAEGQRKAAEDSASLGRITACPCCGEQGAAFGSRSGYCPLCTPVVAQLEAERLGNELVNGRSRREWAEAMFDRRAKAG
jgi:hypothetical protein